MVATLSEPSIWFHAGAAATRKMGFFGHADLPVAASVTNPGGLLGWGWSGSFTVVEGGAADFGSLSDIAPTYAVATLGANNLCRMNDRFLGDYSDKLLCKQFTGVLPTTLIVEWIGRFEVATLDGAGMGLMRVSGAGQNALVTQGATEWSLNVNGSTRAITPQILNNTNWHRFKLVVGATLDLYVDDVLRSSGSVPNDVWPCYLVFTASATGNTSMAWFSHEWQ